MDDDFDRWSREMDIKKLLYDARWMKDRTAAALWNACNKRDTGLMLLPHGRPGGSPPLTPDEVASIDKMSAEMVRIEFLVGDLTVAAGRQDESDDAAVEAGMAVLTGPGKSTLRDTLLADKVQGFARAVVVKDLLPSKDFYAYMWPWIEVVERQNIRPWEMPRGCLLALLSWV